MMVKLALSVDRAEFLLRLLRQVHGQHVSASGRTAEVFHTYSHRQCLATTALLIDGLEEVLAAWHLAEDDRQAVAALDPLAEALGEAAYATGQPAGMSVPHDE